MTVQSGTLDSVPARSIHMRLWAPQSIVYLVAGLYSVFQSDIPEGLQTVLAGAVGLFLIISATLPRLRTQTVLFSIDRLALLAWLATLMLAYLFLIETEMGVYDYITAIVRAMTGVAAIIYFAGAARPVAPSVKLFICLTAALTAIVLTAQHGLYNYADVMRPQPIGAEDAIHSSAYIITATFLAVVLMRLSREISRPVAWIVGLPLLLLVLAYQVRTSWVMLIVFFGVLILSAVRRRLDTRVFTGLLGFAICILLVALSILAIFVLPGLDLSTFSSGRTATYIERLDILSQREFPALLLGSGLGSDSFYSSSWWWEAKDSHNDFLHIAIEQGLLCLAALGLILASTLRHASTLQTAVLLSLLGGSAVSNALLDRPMLAVLYCALLAGAAAPTYGSRAARRPGTDA